MHLSQKSIDELAEDYVAVDRLTLAAFKTFAYPDGSKPGVVDEHFFVHLMRNAAVFVPKLDFARSDRYSKRNQPHVL